MTWHVAYCEQRAEHIAARSLKSAGFEVYLPVEKWTRMRRRKQIDVEKPLFPRYIFVEFNIAARQWGRISDFDGIERVLCNHDIPSTVPTPFIQAIMGADKLGAFDRRKGQPSPYRTGDRVRVNAGPFEGLTATVAELLKKLDCCSATRRARILLDFLGRQVSTEIDIAALG